MWAGFDPVLEWWVKSLFCLPQQLLKTYVSYEKETQENIEKTAKIANSQAFITEVPLDYNRTTVQSKNFAFCRGNICFKIKFEKKEPNALDNTCAGHFSSPVYKHEC
jgi:hypothetical protein